MECLRNAHPWVVRVAACPACRCSRMWANGALDLWAVIMSYQSNTMDSKVGCRSVYFVGFPQYAMTLKTFR